MATIAVLSVLLTQLDKVVLSKVLTLELFGYYTVAWRVASTLYYVVTPITTAFLPRLTQLAIAGDGDELARLYHQGCQVLSALLLPVVVLFVVFPSEILQVWTNDRSVADGAASTLRLLAVGTAISGLLGMPLVLQYAHAWTRLVLVIGTAAAICVSPMIYLASLHYGAEGAAAAWLLLNCAYLASVTSIMHRRLLPGHLLRWFTIDVGVPLLAAALPAVLWKVFGQGADSRALFALQLACVLALSVIAAFMAAPQTRRVALRLGAARVARS
jgi:O-antigen/teichoic acid export membrane protein